MSNTFENFEKLYGTTEFLKAIISIQNEILVEKGITTADELRSRLQTKLIIHDSKAKRSLYKHANKKDKN